MVHVNSDDDSLAHDCEFEKDVGWERLRAKMEEAMKSMMGEESSTGERCRKCGKPAIMLCCGHHKLCRVVDLRSTVQQNREIPIEKVIGIPICSGGQASRCLIKAQQQIHIHSMKILGQKDYHQGRDAAQLICLSSGKWEPDGVRCLACNHCSVAFYCSKECQVYGWQKGHKKGCHPIGETQACAEYKN